MSGIDNEAGGHPKADLQLSRRSMVAAGALLATLGGGLFAAKARAEYGISPHDRDVLCARGENAGREPFCACFLSGTAILTPAGEVAIEDLGIGDLVATEGGKPRAVRWLGRITVRRDGSAPWHPDAMPIRVAKDALCKGSPHRDLYLSRSHMVHLDGVLIPIGDLINGRTITAVDIPGDQLVYYHAILETHDVVVADGAPCESFLTSALKLAVFDNVDEYYALYGAPLDMAPCAPMAAFNGGRSELKSRLRSAISPVVDLRLPRDVVRDRLETRAFEFPKAA
jgi:hypothetical protein